jgi:hypothetical protein
LRKPRVDIKRLRPLHLIIFEREAPMIAAFLRQCCDRYRQVHKLLVQSPLPALKEKEATAGDVPKPPNS